MFMLCGLERTDIVAEYAPWPSGAMKSEAQSESIGCIFRVDVGTGGTVSILLIAQRISIIGWRASKHLEAIVLAHRISALKRP